METPNLLDHLRTRFKPIEVLGRGRIVDDFVYDFERQPREEIRDCDTRFNIFGTRVPERLICQLRKGHKS